MLKVNPYEKCPIYETESFILRLVEESDVDGLLECYSDLSAVKFMNSDRCTSDFHYTTIDEMKNCIQFWLKEYKNKGYVRFSVIDKQTQKAVGSIEIFGGSKFGVLRIDLKSNYEKQSYITEILKISNIYFYDAFSVNHVISKAIPEATKRISALIENGFLKLEDNTILPYGDYYIR